MAAFPDLNEDHSEADVTATQIRHAIDEQKHHIFHLERSNSILRDELKSSPGDEDYISAVEENVVVLSKKRADVRRLFDLLEKTDPAYKQEHAAELAIIFQECCAIQSQNAEDAATSVEQGRAVRNMMETDNLPPIAIYMRGERQTDMEQRILLGVDSDQPQPNADADGGEEPVNANTDVDKQEKGKEEGQGEESVSDSGVYL